ncbi:DUF1592 domain-containing protein [Alienimonas sp. DA493]|uniref:DUF1592 domain-containing protein n=1 Tax=Alienimonas sp. DA493 TaxID=3373605 RepID=UPI0037550D25
MPRLPVVAVVLTALSAAAPAGRLSAGEGAPNEPSAAALAFVESHCLDCHSGEYAEAGFDLDGLAWEFDRPEDFRRWSGAFERVRRGEMPPADALQPDAAERAAVVDALGGALIEADRERQRTVGRSELRRLNRAEYANALKDVLALPHLEVEDMLPPDGSAHGYAKSAAALDVSHVTVSRYLEAADHALRAALAPRLHPVPRKVVRAELKSVEGVEDTLQTLKVQLKQTIAMPLVGTELDPTLEVHRGNFARREPGYVKDPEPHFDGVATFMNSRSNHNVVVKPFKVRQSGTYKIRVRGWGVLNDHGTLVPSDRGETVAFYSPSGRLLGRCDLPPNEPTTSETTVWLNEGEPVEYLAVSTPNENVQLPAKLEPKYETFKSHGIALQWFELEGPLSPWPPESHRRLLGDLELEPTGPQPNGLEYRAVTDDPEADAERLLRRFAERAFRRPVADDALKVSMGQVRGRLANGDPFVDALLAGYRAVLASPEFLLLREEPGELDAYALADRLAFFLTNSPPDGELRAAAADGSLTDDAELRRQTDRLLDDPRAERFAAHFLDDWLDLGAIRETQPDGNLYPEHDALLTESMLEETRAFFAALLREDRGAFHVVDSDFLTINQRLAQLYNIPGVRGSKPQTVPVPEDGVRGGLLTQASLLKVTANGTTTSPVVRGTFVMDRLLGDPPPPPPPSVPAIEPDISGATTIREQLAAHRDVEGCAVCHRKIDPPGFALESFDVMGGYRDRYRVSADRGKGVNRKFNGRPAEYGYGPAVDPSGELSADEPFTDVNGFRERLRGRERQIARNLLEQLLVYATGAPAGFADEAAVEAMLDRLAPGGYGVRSMVHEIVQSPLFRRK